MLAPAAALPAGAPAVATGQIPDVITYQGQARPLHREPLGVLLGQPAHWQAFRAAAGDRICTANWRGCRAWWALREGRLRLERMVHGACDGDRAPAAGGLLPRPQRATGRRLVQRHPGRAVPMGDSTACPRYALVEVQAGAVVASGEVGHATRVRLRRGARPPGGQRGARGRPAGATALIHTRIRWTWETGA